MRIGIDLDTTLVIIKAIDIAATELGLDFTEEHTTDYTLQCYPEMLRQKVFELFNDPNVMCDLAKPIEGAAEKLQEWIDAGHDIILITARDPETMGLDTIELVKRHFPMIKDINLVGFNGKKSELFRNKFIDVWIDDRAEDVLTAASMGIKCFLIQNKFTRYNHHVHNKSRVNGSGTITCVKVVTDVQL